MPRPRRQEFPDFSKKAISSSRFFYKLPTLVGNVALNFFDDSFQREGFIDKRVNKWKPRRFNDKTKGSRKTLVKSGRLRRSLRMRTLVNSVIISTNVPYAQIHNEGGRVQGSFTVRAHRRKTKGGSTSVRSHQRNVNIDIPKRQFMGQSDLLDKRIEMLVTNALDQIFKD
jgi:phage gpG-like protein